MFSKVISLIALALVSTAASAACVEGDRNYLPEADDNDPRWEICTGGRWVKEGASGAYVSNPKKFACVEGERFYRPEAEDNEPRWEVCVGGRLAVEGKDAPYISNPNVTCKEGQTFYDAAADSNDGEPRFYVCRNGKFVAK